MLNFGDVYALEPSESWDHDDHENPTYVKATPGPPRDHELAGMMKISLQGNAVVKIALYILQS